MVSPRRSSRARSSAQPRRPNSHDLDAHTESSTNTANVEDEMDEDTDEITRCVCGNQEYQGGDDDDQTDDNPQDFYIQCDLCKVWQHGYCVGVLGQAAAPENYYCEQCKPELHRMGSGRSGSKTTIYIPAQPERKLSKESTGKRRTTMNSRDAEYDDEMFRKMLEISKQEASTSLETGRRGRKRGTSEDSDGHKPEKRQRSSNTPDRSGPVPHSVDDKPAKATNAKKSRAATSRNSNVGKRSSARNKASEKKESTKEDKSEHSEGYAPAKGRKTNKAHKDDNKKAPMNGEVENGAPQAATKRGGARNAVNGRRRAGRAGRHSEDDSHGSAMSREHSSHGHGKSMDPTSVLEKPTKPRLPQARMSMNEMKRRVSGISEYITRKQIEMANTRESDIYAYLKWMEEKGTPVSNTITPESSKAATPTSASTAASGASSDVEKRLPKIQVGNGSGNQTTQLLDRAAEALNINAGRMAPLAIMELLSSKINHWQQRYGEQTQRS